MSAFHSTALSRPSLGHRSISEQAPLYDPSSTAHAGSRLRGSKATSGSVTKTGSHLPFSPLLPLPPVVDIKLHEAERELADDEQAENCAPNMFPGHHRPSVGPSALATRRQARRGVSEGFAALHPHQLAGNRAGLAVQPAVLTPGGKGALRLDIAAAADTKALQACRSAGMIRSYSMPVATQDEHDEQQRIMALGLSPIGRYAANPAWWQYGWPSPGGVNHRHLHRAPVPEMLGQRRGSAQSKLAAVVAPAMGPSPRSSSPVSPRPSSRSSKTHSSCSPKSKSKHLPAIHQQTFSRAAAAASAGASSSASSSPKVGRSPLSMISTNLPAVEPHAPEPAEAAFDIEMDALNQRFAQWSREAAPGIGLDEDYFNLAHDGGVLDARFQPAGAGSDSSDEARTPRAASPRLHAKPSLLLDTLDFVHPDHLAGGSD